MIKEYKNQVEIVGRVGSISQKGENYIIAIRTQKRGAYKEQYPDTVWHHITIEEERFFPLIEKLSANDWVHISGHLQNRLFNTDDVDYVTYTVIADIVELV
ncbi:MAG: hypothetical protein II661_09645 [Bacteroidales bacterium]|nr:hypothetical protein [Bacteroidales bacterium]